MHTLTLLDIPVHAVTLPQAVERVAGLLATGQSSQIATVNPEFVMLAQGHAPFRQVLQRAALCVADGVGITLAARWLGQPLPARVTGVALCLALAERAAAAGWRVFLLGAAPGVAETTADVLRTHFPTLTIVGCYAGSPHPDDAPAIIQRIHEAAPQLLFVAYGAPAQDLWIATHQAATGVPIAMGVGGTFDYLAGRVPYAPTIIRRIGLEWLYRLIRQPWRWRRMLALPRFVWAVARAK